MTLYSTTIFFDLLLTKIQVSNYKKADFVIREDKREREIREASNYVGQGLPAAGKHCKTRSEQNAKFTDQKNVQVS